MQKEVETEFDDIRERKRGWRLYNILRQNGFTTLAEIGSLKPTELKELKNYGMGLGKTLISDLREYLKSKKIILPMTGLGWEKVDSDIIESMEVEGEDFLNQWLLGFQDFMDLSVSETKPWDAEERQFETMLIFSEENPMVYKKTFDNLEEAQLYVIRAAVENFNIALSFLRNAEKEIARKIRANEFATYAKDNTCICGHLKRQHRKSACEENTYWFCLACNCQKYEKEENEDATK